MRMLGLDVRRVGPAEPVLRQFLDLTAPDVVVDVGANTGEFVASVRAAGFGGRVIAIEPVPELAQRLEASGIETHSVAAGDADSTAELTIFEDTKLSSLYSLSPLAREVWSADDAGLRANRTVSVPVKRLDSLLDVSGTLFLKVDTQGHDAAAIRGAAGILDQVVLLQTELAFQSLYNGIPAVEDRLRELRDMGFVLAALTPVGYAPGGAIVEADGLFVKAGPDLSRDEPAGSAQTP